MGSNVSIHTRPVVTLKEALFGFVDAVVPNKFIAMGIYEGLLFKTSREKNDDSAGLKLTFNSAPNNVIFNKAVVSEKFNERLALCIGGLFFVEQKIFQRF